MKALSAIIVSPLFVSMKTKTKFKINAKEFLNEKTQEGGLLVL